MRTCVLLNMPLFYTTVRRQRGHVHERVELARNPEVACFNPQSGGPKSRYNHQMDRFNVLPRPRLSIANWFASCQAGFVIVLRLN